MIDIGQKLRKAYYSALSGNITYSGKTVPVVDEKLESNIADNDLYVLFTTQNETDANNKSYFARECDLVMTVVNQRKATNTKEAVENVSSQILTILFPTKNSLGLTVDAPIKLTYARLTNAEYNPLVQTENGFIISKSLTIRNRITQ